MNPFLQTSEAIPSFNAIKACLLGGESPVLVTGVSHVHKAQLLHYVSCGFSPLLVVASDEMVCRQLCEDINLMAGSEVSMVYPAREFTAATVDSRSREYEHIRIGALSRVLSGECDILIVSAEAAMQLALPPDKLRATTITLCVGDEIDMGDLAAALTDCGYMRFEKVEEPSQFSMRGSIIDIFPVSASCPVRFELWGDTIDTLAFFDTETQRRTAELKKIEIPPASEQIFSRTELADKIDSMLRSLRNKKREEIVKNLSAEAALLRDGITPASIDKYIPLMYEGQHTLIDYPFAAAAVCELSDCLDRSRGVLQQYNEDITILLEQGLICRGLEGHYLSFETFADSLSNLPVLYADSFMRGSTKIPYKKAIGVNAMQHSPWGGEIHVLVEELENYSKSDFSVILVAGGEKQLPTIANDLQEKGIKVDLLSSGATLSSGRVLLTSGSLSSGWEYPDIKHAMITATKTVVKRQVRSKRKKSEEIRSLSDISPGDLIVHNNHGIGRFSGIRQLELEGVKKDYIAIQYAGTDVLYVPVTQLDTVSKYIGARDDGKIKLNKLSSNEWLKARNNVKKACRDMAAELIALYAKREKSRGFAFSLDGDWQKDFERRFEYVETGDQLTSIEEIKSDMERERPMDRLLCGDVGFGKTEVAFRAAFKCVMSGKQCAILAPTTVLAFQHFQTASSRFEHFPIKIELISRFRTAKQQTEILRKLKRGEVDIIIGTHRLVQKDVIFHDLGLAVIDEEQRFGVAHKEKFKEMFSGVDILTLSATPIPRTLNMAMSGLRDMSVIEEPPQDRYPVQTYVIEHDLGIIAQAISRELRRGGQVYYIHNRIESIHSCAGKLAKLFPEAKISVAHGRITEEALSDVWRRLVDHDTDILVCTTIIETGVDVPNVNTLIIEDADFFGLSQLYQLRGRVGRSTRRAYAYLTFKPQKVLTEIASQRLKAIRDFTQFGSGFRIAMRDLEIRGAGSILGGKQHGHMESVGYDMYLKLLEEAIAEEKGEQSTLKAADCLIDIQIEAHIPEKYISSLSQRLDVYRKIAAVEDEDDATDLVDELIDRYGEPPKSIKGLIDVALMRSRAVKLGITEIAQKNENLLFYTDSATVQQLSALAGEFKGRMLYNSMNRPYISIKFIKSQSQLKLIDLVMTAMENA